MKKENDSHPCEAPVHSELCDGVGISMDHFTPVCIGKLWGWEKDQINAPENIQYLSKPCHLEKDRTTEARLTLARKQLNGAYISLEYYLTVEDPNFNLEKDRPKKPTNGKHSGDRGCIRRNGGKNRGCSGK